MLNYQPCQYLNWYYDQNEGILKIKSYIMVKYDPNDGAKRITSTRTGLIKDLGAIVTLSVHKDGTADPNPMSIDGNIWTVSDIGTNLTQDEVKGFIRNLKQFQVMATIDYAGEIHETINSSSQNSGLEYS